MCDGEEVWQVAGRRRHRPPELRRIAVPGSAASSSRRQPSRKSKRSTSHGGYSYETRAKNGPGGQAAAGEKEELVKNELAKLEQLKLLLRETAMWERLVEGLGGVLPQLGIAAPCEAEDSPGDPWPAVASPAAAAAGDETSASSGPDSPANGPQRRRRLEELVCYGIGNFSENHSSRYQFALALCLRDLLFKTSSPGDVETAAAAAAAAADPAAVDPATADPASGDPAAAAIAAAAAAAAANSAAAAGPAILVYDPVMGETEIAILAALGCGTLDNEEGKRSCCGEVGKGGGGGDGGDPGAGSHARPTLFFMPHCPQRLYGNVLWANWSSHALGSIVILGNKLSSYGDRLLDARTRADPTNALLRAGPLLRDIDLLPYPAADSARWRRDVERLPRVERAFNDLALTFSAPEARGSAAGAELLRNRPLEFVEAADGELVTGRAAGANAA